MYGRSRSTLFPMIPCNKFRFVERVHRANAYVAYTQCIRCFLWLMPQRKSTFRRNTCFAFQWKINAIAMRYVHFIRSLFSFRSLKLFYCSSDFLLWIENGKNRKERIQNHPLFNGLGKCALSLWMHSQSTRIGHTQCTSAQIRRFTMISTAYCAHKYTHTHTDIIAFKSFHSLNVWDFPFLQSCDLLDRFFRLSVFFGFKRKLTGR